MKRNVAQSLRDYGIQPSAQRLAVASYVLDTDEHPSADEVLRRASAALPMISRATVYNTLNLFVNKGLVRELVLAEGRSVFDCNLEKHHHFIDESTGTIHDVPWDAVRVSRVDQLAGYEIKEYMVVLRGRRTPARGKRARHC
ncbi:MAG: transcriptional repressor [Myxococcales bacterium]|nr:transcriptional repressor [Myxococcales bacterium]